jgi:hypothetical protein
MPDPDSWYNAVLVSVNKSQLLMTAVLETGEEVFVHARSISFAPYSHYFCLPVGTGMSVRLQRQFDTSLLALEAQFEADPDAPVITEKGVVEYWQFNHGSISRPCGCRIFAMSYREHKIGDVVDMEVKFSKRRGNFMAEIL